MSDESEKPILITRVETKVVVKAWAPANDVRDIFGIPATALRKLVEDGDVRKKKMPGAEQQAGATYCLQDIVDWLEGRIPAPEARA